MRMAASRDGMTTRMARKQGGAGARAGEHERSITTGGSVRGYLAWFFLDKNPLNLDFNDFCAFQR
jgi:hypothetical protein